jgi:hypothetical protein
MEIGIRIKSAARRRPVLEIAAFAVPDGISSGEALVESIVRENVRRYNAKETDAPLFRYLSAEEIEEGAHRGKVGFGDRKNENPQDEDAAVQTALGCYADGLFKLLAGEEEVPPGSALTLKEGDIVTFIRLVLLAGRRW